MAGWTVKVGFDATTSTIGNTFVLDDPVRGQLDNPDYVLGGLLFVDVTQYLKSLTISRGKSRELDRYNAGQATVVFDNRTRAFDPTFEASPYYGNIVPRREIKLLYNDVEQFRGFIDDWNLNYDLNGNSTAEASCSDAFSFLANQTLDGGVQTSQLSGARINAVLNDPSVNWSASRRQIMSGQMLLGADTIAPDTIALNYLQLIETTEPGALFIGKNGDVVFKDRSDGPASSGALLLSDTPGGGAVVYRTVSVNYGSELLYNQVVVSRVGGGTAVADDTGSQSEYGIQTLTYTDLLMASDADVDNLALYLGSLYASPEFRFDAVNLDLRSLSTTQANQIMALELKDNVRVSFTPNGIAPAIERYGEVIRIDIAHDVSSLTTDVSLGFTTVSVSPIVLDDLVFGKLDSGNVLGF